jgi:hypothetical protein
MIRFRKAGQRTILIVLCFMLFDTPCSIAGTKPAINWWPDPSTGLMWTGDAYLHYFSGINWKNADKYCSTLSIGGISGWRLPTIDEARAAMAPSVVAEVNIPKGATRSRDGAIPPSPAVYYPSYSSRFFKGKITTIAGNVWTSTLVDRKSAAVAKPGGFFHTDGTSRVTAHINRSALCVRPMEPDLLQIAKDAQVDYPVTDVLMLKAIIPLTKASVAYQLVNIRRPSSRRGRPSRSIPTSHKPIGPSVSLMAGWANGIWPLPIFRRPSKLTGTTAMQRLRFSGHSKVRTLQNPEEAPKCHLQCGTDSPFCVALTTGFL